MRATFRVQGRDATEIRERADAQIEAFFGAEAEVVQKIEARPVVQRFGELEVAMWEGEVEAWER